MKKIIKLSILLFIGIIVVKTLEVKAVSYNDSFYPGPFISNEYIRKEKNGEKEDKQSRFIFRTSDDMFAYCIEPFKLMKENEIYKAYTDTSLDKAKITETIWQKIRLISYYGYGYGNHKEDKWFTITQMMIWKVIDPKANFNWIDKIGGKVITKYEKEMNEINQLVEKHNYLPNFANKTLNASINQKLEIIDENFNLGGFKLYSSQGLNVSQLGNKITLSSETPGHYEIRFIKDDTRFKNIPIIYIDDVAQNIIVVGNNESIRFNLYIDVESGTLKINKLDKDTKSIISNSEASIIGTTFNLYNDQKELLSILTVDSNGQTTYENLPYGKYCIQETKSGEGYIIDGEEHCFIIDTNDLNIELNLYNEVKKEEIIINKYLELEEQKLKKEPNIKFTITGINHSYEETFTTDKNGQIRIILPYGKYLVEQVNTTEGYLKVDNFIIKVDGQKLKQTYELVDKKQFYQIEVPNTGINKINIKKTLLIISLFSYIGLLTNETIHKSNNS